MTNWRWLRDFLPRKSHPGDIDGFLELDGVIYFLEQKKPGQVLDGAQEMAYRHLSAYGMMVIVVYASDDWSRVDGCTILGAQHDEDRDFDLCDRNDFGRFLADLIETAAPNMIPIPLRILLQTWRRQWVARLRNRRQIRD